MERSRALPKYRPTPPPLDSRPSAAQCPATSAPDSQLSRNKSTPGRCAWVERPRVVLPPVDPGSCCCVTLNDPGSLGDLGPIGIAAGITIVPGTSVIGGITLVPGTTVMAQDGPGSSGIKSTPGRWSQYDPGSCEHHDPGSYCRTNEPGSCCTRGRTVRLLLASLRPGVIPGRRPRVIPRVLTTRGRLLGCAAPWHAPTPLAPRQRYLLPALQLIPRLLEE